MLAHHPKTGKPIRVLKSDASISRDNRTLVWVQPTFEASQRWSRWSSLISDPAAAAVLCGAEPTVAVIHHFSEAWSAFLTGLSPTSECIVFVSRSALKAVKALNIEVANMLLLTELFDLYPYLGEPVTDADPVEKTVIAAAHILRHAHVVWSASEIAVGDAGVAAQIAAWKRHVGKSVRSVATEAIAAEVVPACWLIQQYFKHSNGRRDREITTCLERNVANPHIDHVLLLQESEAEVPVTKNPKIQTQVSGRRLTYVDVLRAAKTTVPAGDFVVFANADIWFDDSLRFLWSIPLTERRLFLALLRWEAPAEEGAEPTLFGPRADSQDAWCLSRDTLDFEPTDEAFGIEFGRGGCDNAITVGMLRQKFLVVNPAYSLKAHHLHVSNIRNYDPLDIVDKPVYMYVDPTPIQSLAVDIGNGRAWLSPQQEAWVALNSQESFGRPLLAVEEAAGKTVCAMLNRQEGAAYALNAANIWTPTAAGPPLYEWREDMFVSTEGLLSNFKSLLIGPHISWRHGWESAQVSTMTPCQHIPAILSVPPPSDWTSLSDWVLSSLPHILRARQAVAETREAEFVVPNIPALADFLMDCVWAHGEHVGTIPYMEDTQYFCNRVWSVPPVKQKPTREHMALLRSILPAAEQEQGPGHRRTLVLCCEDNEATETAVLTRGWAEEVVACHGGGVLDGWTIQILPTSASHAQRRAAFQAADWIVGTRETGLAWLWMAAPGTRILEFMSESDIRDDILHLAGAAECPYIVGLVRREPVEFQREHALIDVGKAIRQYGFKDLLVASRNVEDLPVVTVPTGKGLEGIWSHSGDTFREMVSLWEERGYCRVKRSEATGHCWWGDVGEVILYDRPTPRWWSQPPSYQMALFGNCAPPGPDAQRLRQSVWSFWPRSPRALEAYLEANGVLGWSERPTASVFLGKVENGVQHKYRCDGAEDWSQAVELFSMPTDAAAPYRYSQQEYLAKVAGSRWGLCLRGYGPKCNREIEYMALGTVPIVTADVDMSGYLEPPREGVHFLRAATVADVRRIVAETPQTTWEAMSRACHTWWRKNASAEGLFRLTWARIEQCRPFWDTGVLPGSWGKPHH